MRAIRAAQLGSRISAVACFPYREAACAFSVMTGQRCRRIMPLRYEAVLVGYSSQGTGSTSWMLRPTFYCRSSITLATIRSIFVSGRLLCPVRSACRVSRWSTPGDLAASDLARAACVRAFLGDPKLILLESPVQGRFNSLIAPLLDALAAARDRGAAAIWFTRSDLVWHDLSFPATHRLRLGERGLVPVGLST